jgi:hypothetical protein
MSIVVFILCILHKLVRTVSMRAATVLLALIVVLSACVAKAGERDEVYYHFYTFAVGEQHFGFADRIIVFSGRADATDLLSLISLGPLGSHEVPFTATQGLIGFCVILAVLITLLVMLTVRWKEKHR